jgi:CRISPR-associated exonuclease Cas4
VDEREVIPISALQHYLYCPRQCALIHVERLWAENVHTAEGRLLHRRSEKLLSEMRRGVRTATALPLGSEQLGLSGLADVVEFHDVGGIQQPFPIEYKRGRPRAHRADEVQLCAQALCLEEMLSVPVPVGALFYGKTRRRVNVAFDTSLRTLTLEVIAFVRAQIDNGHTPPADYLAARCDACSLLDLCQPRRRTAQRDVKAWLRREIDEESS